MTMRKRGEGEKTKLERIVKAILDLQLNLCRHDIVRIYVKIINWVGR